MSSIRKKFFVGTPHQKKRSFFGLPPGRKNKAAFLVTGQVFGGSKKKKVFVAMSGGVDSSVAAFLLREQGYGVMGVFMRCYNLDGCADRDAEDARRVAEHIGIPFYVWDFEEEYKKRVVDYMVEGYRVGITPNPDVMCNREIKFGLFLEKALRMGADYVATGHYVRLRQVLSTNSESLTNKRMKSGFVNSKSIRYSLISARDAQKDQSYFLWTLTQAQLTHCLFPIGDYLKSEVRAIARKAGLPTADKKDSQGICFLGKVTLADFLAAYIPERPGKVLTASGREIGTHRGAEFYTIGQRHIGVASRAPIYVAEKDMKTNTLIVAEGDNDPALYRKEIELNGVNFINPIPPKRPSPRAVGHTLNPKGRASGISPIPCFARVRYRQPVSEAVLTFGKKGSAKLVFKKAQKFVAEGQSAVFYAKKRDPSTTSGLEMLGGGIVTKAA